MRFNKKKDYAEISRRSIQRDFHRPQYRRNVETKRYNEPPKENAERRITFVGENSSYFRFRHLLIGKLVRLINQSSLTGGWICRFVYEEDAKALNKAADWSENKQEYIFDNVKFK